MDRLTEESEINMFQDDVDWDAENGMQAQVREFMLNKYQERGSSERALSPEGKLLRFRLIHEEAGELCSAIMKGDEVEVVDGICDLLYVTFGAAEAYGINIKPFFDEVHRTNMLKDSGVKDEFGKTIKPPGWKPPRIAEMLALIRTMKPADYTIEQPIDYFKRHTDDKVGDMMRENLFDKHGSGEG